MMRNGQENSMPPTGTLRFDMYIYEYKPTVRVTFHTAETTRSSDAIHCKFRVTSE
jgi:hypothetical protein